MKGYTFPKSGSLPTDDDMPQGMSSWQVTALNAVGVVIEFWGFKRNQGKVWALLFLCGEPMSAADLQHTLELSKGAVSMIVRELESWGVIQRQRVEDSSAWHFVAEVDLIKMIGQVFRQREVRLVKHVREDLEHALRLAKLEDDVPAKQLARLDQMTKLARLIDQALNVFLSTSQLDMSKTHDIFQDLANDSSREDSNG